MAINLSKQKLLLFGIIALTIFLAGAAVVTALLLQSRNNVNPTPSKAASACGSAGEEGCKCNYTIGASCGSVFCADGFNAYSGTYACYTDGTDACVSNANACSAHGGVATTQPTAAPTQSISQLCAGKTGIVYAGMNGSGIQVINCSSTTIAKNSLSFPVLKFTCSSNSGDPGKAGQCSANQSSLGSVSNTFDIAPGSNAVVGLPSCSVSCGSCQTDITSPDGSATDGKFVAAAASCNITTNTNTPVPGVAKCNSLTINPSTGLKVGDTPTVSVQFSNTLKDFTYKVAVQNTNTQATAFYDYASTSQNCNKASGTCTFTTSQLPELNNNGGLNYKAFIIPSDNAVDVNACAKTFSISNTTTRAPNSTPTNTPTPSSTPNPFETPTPVVTSTVPPSVLPETGIWDELIIPTLIGLGFITIAIVLINKPLRRE